MKFSIRDLLLVTVIVALTVGWAVDRTRLARELHRLTLPSLQVTEDGTITPPRGYQSMGLKYNH